MQLISDNLTNIFTYSKKEATEEDVQLMCKAIANAKCLEDIPKIRDDVYFSPQQARRITNTGNPFVSKIMKLADALKRDKLNCLIK